MSDCNDLKTDHTGVNLQVAFTCASIVCFPSDSPCVCCLNNSRDGAALERFLQDYFDGKLKRYLKSEPIPETNDGPVKVRNIQGHSLFPLMYTG